ncbi:MAG: hypothetical protein HY471_01220 [Candidatus Sungbacteria bacterium]|nr:hypothetical protein [Candidatus Sungbacteria bacterium]
MRIPSVIGHVSSRRLVVLLLAIAVAAGSWDAWWHVAVGRDTFWEPPHLLLYGAAAAAILLSFLSWRRTDSKSWRNLFFILLGIPASAPFDEVWHRMFGVENLSSPLVIWSPPHLVLIFSFLFGLLYGVARLAREDRNSEARDFLGSIGFGAVLWLLYLIFIPFHPLGPYRILGFWGIGAFAFSLAFTLLFVRRLLPGFQNVLIAIFVFILLALMGFAIPSPTVIIPPHVHPPTWLTVFSFLLSAVVIDVLKGRPLWLAGFLSGFVWVTTLFAFSGAFFSPEFQYGLSQAVSAVISGSAGALAAGIVFSWVFTVDYHARWI